MLCSRFCHALNVCYLPCLETSNPFSSLRAQLRAWSPSLLCIPAAFRPPASSLFRFPHEILNGAQQTYALSEFWQKKGPALPKIIESFFDILSMETSVSYDHHQSELSNTWLNFEAGYLRKVSTTWTFKLKDWFTHALPFITILTVANTPVVQITPSYSHIAYLKSTTSAIFNETKRNGKARNFEQA